jgi:signal transduction histidine kinase
MTVRGDGTAGQAPKGADPRLRVAAAAGAATLLAFAWVAWVGRMVLGEGAADDLLRGLAIALGVALPAAVAAAWTGVAAVTRDIRRVTRAAKAMVDDEGWGRPVPLGRLDEVGEVTRRVEELRVHCAHSVERARRARREAEQADRDKTEFLTSISHELRTPLNAIVGFADVLLAEIEGPLNPSQREDLATIRGAGLHLVALFTDVLDLSAAASGHLRLERSRVEVGTILETVAAELRGQRRDRPVEIHAPRPGDLPALRADPKRLRQVVTNLAGNALKFTEQGEVRLEATQDGPWVVLTISDTGVGMTPEALDTLFDEFTQAGDAARRRRGTGLGLAISRQLVELHGGTIAVESSPGRGTTVTVRLPVEEIV